MKKNIDSQFKLQLYQMLMESLQLRAEVAQQAIVSAKEARDNDTKSSAGDKYETGRSMMQMEIGKSESQLYNVNVLLNELYKINPTDSNPMIVLGSLVLTNQQNYFISVAVGKFMLENTDVYAISLASPLGKALAGKSAGDTVNFQGREIVIEKIL